MHPSAFSTRHFGIGSYCIPRYQNAAVTYRLTVSDRKVTRVESTADNVKGCCNYLRKTYA